MNSPVSVVTLPATVVVVILVTVYVVCVYVDVTAATCAAGVAATSRFPNTVTLEPECLRWSLLSSLSPHHDGRFSILTPARSGIIRTGRIIALWCCCDYGGPVTCYLPISCCPGDRRSNCGRRCLWIACDCPGRSATCCSNGSGYDDQSLSLHNGSQNSRGSCCSSNADNNGWCRLQMSC